MIVALARSSLRHIFFSVSVGLSAVPANVSLANAYDQDLHFGATFALALSLGFGWDRSLLIASAD
jgi:hypothetical protein